MGRLAVLGILTLSGVFVMDRSDLNIIYYGVMSAAIISTLVTRFAIKRNPASKNPYWFLLYLDAFLLALIIYISGGVDGPFMPFLVLHSLTYGYYLGVSGGATAASVNIVLAIISSVIAINIPGPKTTLSPLLIALIQTGQSKLSVQYITLRIFINGLLLAASGITSGFFAQLIYSETGQLQNVLRNLSELRARSRYILNSLHDGVVVVDHEGELISINPSAIELLGTDKPLKESPLGEMVSSFQAKEDFPLSIDIIIGKKIIECRFTEYRNTEGVIVVLIDTTDARNYRAIIEEQDKLALIGRLSATMAHEIRNPLATMSGAADLLAGGKLSTEKAERMASLIQKQSSRVSELIEGYLSLSRNSADFPFKLLEVNDIVMDSVESAMHGFAGGALIEVVKSDQQLFIQGSKVRLGQVILNLIRNAVEAQSDKLTINITKQEDAAFVSIAVMDNGSGIPEEFISAIWEPFKTSRELGTGLGLYIVKKIIKEHSGSVDVQNSISGGACFTILLPLELNSGV